MPLYTSQSSTWLQLHLFWNFVNCWYLFDLPVQKIHVFCDGFIFVCAFLGSRGRKRSKKSFYCCTFPYCVSRCVGTSCKTKSCLVTIVTIILIRIFLSCFTQSVLKSLFQHCSQKPFSPPPLPILFTSWYFEYNAKWMELCVLNNETLTK